MNTQQIIKRQEAIKLGLKHYFTGIPCKRGHIEKRLVTTGTCQECTRIKQNTYHKRRLERETPEEKRLRLDKINEKNKHRPKIASEKLAVYRKRYWEKKMSDPERHQQSKDYQKDLVKQKKEEIPGYLEAYREYQKEYHRNRRNNDPEYRERTKKHSKESAQRTKQKEKEESQ